MVKAKVIMYDKENDILYIKAKGRVKDSIEIDNFVIDFADQTHVIGVEIQNASYLLKNCLIFQ